MSHPAAPTSLDKLCKFHFEKVINEDPLTHSLTLLGSFPAEDTTDSDRVKAIVRIEKTALHPERASSYFAPQSGLIRRVSLEESTDIVSTPWSPLPVIFWNLVQYTWLYGWLGEERERDVKINVVCPATEVHVRKVCVDYLKAGKIAGDIWRTVHKTRTDHGEGDARTVWKHSQTIYRGLSSSKDSMVTTPRSSFDRWMFRRHIGSKTSCSVFLNSQKSYIPPLPS